MFEVDGSIEGDGGACDGFGFVELTADPLTTLVSQIAAVVGLLALIGLLVLVFDRTREASVVLPETVVEDDVAPDFDETGLATSVEGPPATAAAGGVAGAAGGAHLRPEDVEPERHPAAV